jgi:hypothetical protein
MTGIAGVRLPIPEHVSLVRSHPRFDEEKTAMRSRILLLAASLTLSLGGVFVVLYAQDGASVAATNPEKKELPPQIAESRIVRVTVYPDSALVSREVEVPAGKGSLELVVSPLPEQTVNSSLYSESGDGIRVLTTRFRTRPVKEDTREEVRKLEEEDRRIRREIQKIQADIQANQANTKLIEKLEGFTAASTTHATENGKLNSEETIALAKYLMEGRSEKTKEQVDLQQKIEDLQEQSQFVARKLNEMTSGSSKVERDAVITVDKSCEEKGSVQLNYLVSAASWKPQYKFRAGQTAKDPVSLEYLAAIMQHTGEEWEDVEIVLSTAQPMLNATPPELHRLAVAVLPQTAVAQAAAPGVPNPPGQGGFNFGNQGFQGGNLGGQLGAIPQTTSPSALNQTARMLRQQAQQEFLEKKETVGNEYANAAAAVEQARDLVLGKQSLKAIAEERRNEGPSVTYHLKTRLTVPSRNDEQVIEVTRFDLEPKYFYKAVPVVSRHVYRQATLTNKSEYVLLPGEATMYHGRDFVGRMNLHLVAIGEEFTVGFGAEPQLQVERQMMEKMRATHGGNQVLTYDYRILVSSYKNEPVRLELWDRLPEAQNETMGVTLVKATPDVSTDPMYVREERPHNLLRWDLNLEPGTNGEKALAINYQFKVELDRQMTFGSFQNRK